MLPLFSPAERRCIGRNRADGGLPYLQRSPTARQRRPALVYAAFCGEVANLRGIGRDALSWIV